MKLQTVFTMVDVKEELPKEYNRDLIFFRKGIPYHCTFWFDGDEKRTHISPNEKSLRHYEDAGFTHWLKPSKAYTLTEAEIVEMLNAAYDAGCDLKTDIQECRSGEHIITKEEYIANLLKQ